MLTRKMYTPARTAARNPYWHKIWVTLPLLAQNLGPNPYPYWHKSTKREPFLAIAEKMVTWYKCRRIVLKIPPILWILTCYPLPGTATGKTTPFLAHIWCSKP